MNVATINYWQVCGPSAKEKNKELAARWNRLSLDLLLIQEGIGGLGNLIHGTTNSIRDLAKLINAHYYSIPCFPCRPWPSFISHFAIGIISKHPIDNPQHLQIGKRRHLKAVVNQIPVINVHLDPHQSTHDQILQLTHHIPKTGQVIIGGDFNHQPAPQLLEVIAATAPQPAQNLIDHIIWRGYNGTVKAETIHFSDHPFVWAKLK